MKTTLKTLTAALILSASSSVFAAENYVIDTKGMHAFVEFKINHLGYSWLKGRFNDFEGTFTYDEKNLSASNVSVTINTKSVDSNHAERDKHLRSADFLNVSEFPKATFNSTKVVNTDKGLADIHGELTLNGVTKTIVIKAQEIGAGSDPWGGFRRGFEGTTEIALKDFGINFNLGPASEKVELHLNIEGVRK